VKWVGKVWKLVFMMAVSLAANRQPTTRNEKLQHRRGFSSNYRLEAAPVLEFNFQSNRRNLTAASA